VTQTDSNVERDRAEITAAVAHEFGDRANLAAAYADVLVTIGIERGLLGPREAGRVWERHLLNSVAIATLIPQGARVADLGSGAGLPGLPLAIARPDLEMVLVEPMARRVRFLMECVQRLALDRVTVHHGRAEDGLRPPADVVVARAVARFDRLVDLAEPLLISGGLILALKGDAARSELQQGGYPRMVDAEVLQMPAPGRPATVIRATLAHRAARQPRSARAHRRPG
jgi:16S rRNA (guanine527-N7)-methyltransferase